MPSTYVIGDIHGALKALQQLIGRVAPAKEDQLIFLGDYVDGWSESAGVIAYLMELAQQHPCIFLRGNHDAWCQAWMNGASPDPSWLIHGGKATIASYTPLSEAAKKQHYAFFYDMRNYHIDAQNRLFIHAGFTSMHGPAHERFEAMTYWDRTLWEMALAMDKRIERDSALYPKRLRQFEEIFIGHTPTLNYDEYLPMKACNVYNVDTGAAFTGKLSAMDIASKEVWQSDTVQTLYPHEKGRNQ
ncbi:metallophosphoesterase family protein [Chitinophaga nivalis]|uniref:Serine/threonine protein phosphatase n=1 Tax=Chitinophaga nivalis TaxID=2991709 RepID=A0ABT3IGH9_9BACT|nr:metallophosphoesterase family protein [Chitinophaga nivalis]MCW3467262.1 serine/threonine protein phosphatase [Chitinophaga nivalis]MCW3483046.1 serine/threonine protein phosphatase [Chitinophaga nivalis]